MAETALVMLIVIIISIIHIENKAKERKEREKQEKEKYIKEVIKFVPTKKIGDYFYIDEVNKKWTIPQGILKKEIDVSKIHSYNEIISYELLENGEVVSSGGIGRAIVGGVLLGPVGAILGGITGHKTKSKCLSLQIKITLDNINNPTEYIDLVYITVKKNEPAYKEAIMYAQEIMSILQIICDARNVRDNNKEINNMEEMKKYKQLLDLEVITQEEFNQKKKELLNL